jgi:hypothetical protein
MRCGCAVPPTVRAALARSGEYDGDIITVDRHKLEGVVVQVAKGAWHGVPLPGEVAAVLPRLGGVKSGLVALPLVLGKQRDVSLTGVAAALNHVTKIRTIIFTGRWSTRPS